MSQVNHMYEYDTYISSHTVESYLKLLGEGCELFNNMLMLDFNQSNVCMTRVNLGLNNNNNTSLLIAPFS